MKLTKDYILGLIEGYTRAISYITTIFSSSSDPATAAEADIMITRMEAMKTQYEIYLAKHFSDNSSYEDIDGEFSNIYQA